MPIDADHVPAQSHRSGPLPRLAGIAVVLEAVADTIAVTAPDTGSPAEPPAFDSASQAWPTGPAPAPRPIPTHCPEVISVAVQPKVVRPPVPAAQRPRRLTIDDGEGTGGQATQGGEQPSAPLDAETNATATTPARRSSASGAAALVVVPLVGTLAVLAAVVVVNATNSWWSLVPAMLIALVATACVLSAVVRMLADND